MGGKSNQSQRTKNNARPSSSGRSAELLQNATNVDQFLTAGSGKTPVLFPSLASANMDQDLTPEYSVCFKKFSKKDPVTKIKALQEFKELVKAGSVDDLKAALPSWAHHYQALTFDCDHRVREAAQLGHGAVAGASGRRVARVLRRVLPVWLLALHDEHAPAAAAARDHLQSTFPGAKLAEALLFCKAEIVSLLSDNLTGNADAMIAKKPDDEEERQRQVARVLAGSLHAAALLLRLLDAPHSEWLWAAFAAPLLQHPHYWRLAASPQQHIRGAWYAATGCALERFGARVAPPLGQRAVRALLAEPERSAGVAERRWRALLQLATHVEDWHTWLEKKDLLTTRLLDLIENGAWGEARVAKELLLPLLARLPPELLTKDFYTKLFSAMFVGLNNRNLIKSKSERQTWMSNMVECLRYLTTQNQDYVVEVITYVHRTWVERILEITKQTYTSKNLISHSTKHMASLVKYWLSQSKVENSDKYDQLIRNFWQNISSTILAQIEILTIEQNDIKQSIESHTLLLKTLQASLLKKNEKKLRIRFEDQKEDPADEKSADEVDVLNDDQLKERYKHNLNEVVQRTVCSYVDFANNKQVAQAVFPVLTPLLIEFDSRNLFVAVADHFDAETVYGFYDQVLRPWLAGDTMRCKALVEVVFQLIKYLTEEEQETLFNSFQQFPPSVVTWCMQLSLSHPQRAAPSAARWLRGAVVRASVLGLAERDDDENAIGLLLTCLENDETEQPLVGEETAARLARGLRARLRDGAAGAGLAARVLRALEPGAARAHAAALLRELLRCRLQRPHDAEPHAAAALDAWRAALPAPRRAQLAEGSLRDLCHHVFAHMEDLDIKRIERAASFCPSLFGATEGNEQNIAEIVSLSKTLFALVETNQPQNPLELYALRCDCIYGNITLAFEKTNELFQTISTTSATIHEELSKEDFIVCSCKSLFRMFFLRKITQSKSNESDENSNPWCNVLLSDSHFKEEFSQVMYDYAITKTLFDYYAFWPHYEIIIETKQKMESLLVDIINDITIETKDAIYSFLTESFHKVGFYWQFARKLFDMKFIEISKARDVKKTQKITHESIQNSKIHAKHSKAECYVDDGAKVLGDVENVSNIILEEPGSLTTTEDNISITQIEQSDSKVNPEQSTSRPPEFHNMVHKNKTKDVDQQSYVAEKIKSVIKPGPKQSKTATGRKVFESKPEKTNVESKLEQTKTKSNQSKSKSKSKSDGAGSKSTSELDEAHYSIGKSEHQDQVQWETLLGFPCLQAVVSNSAYYFNLQVEAKYSPEQQRDYRTKFMVLMRCLLSAHAHQRPAFTRLLLAIGSAGAHGLDPIISGYHDYERGQSMMLFDRSLENVPWIQITGNAAIADFLCDMVYLQGRNMSSEHWDFVNIVLSSLLNSIALTPGLWATTNGATLLRAAARLFARVHNYMLELRCFERRPAPALAAALREWHDVFAPDVNRHLFALLLAALRSADAPVTASSAAAMDSLVRAARDMDWELLGAAAPPLDDFAAAAAAALTGARHHACAYLAFSTLRLLAGPLLEEDARRLYAWAAEEQEGKPRPAMCFELLADAVELMQDYTQAALASVKLCEETCEMVPFSDSHRVALGYLLLAAAYMELCERARGDLQQLFIVEFRERRFADGLMACTLRLLPEPVAAFAYERGPALDARALDAFRELPELLLHEHCSSGTLSAIACHVLKETLAGPGAAGARSWGGGAPARVAAGLRRLVPVAVTPLLLQQQLAELRDRALELHGARVSIFWSRGEVKCWVDLEETELELTIRFAPDHPLSPPTITTPPRSPAPATSWIVLYLTYQNGRLLNALKMWIQAVNARIQSAPQCYVCYCRLHPSTGRLPAVPCHQCKNKFHNVCLRKWFQHSQKSNCPLCRTKF